MSYEQKDGQGALFKNDRKERDQHPDYKGSITIDGVEMWLSAWLKEGKNGKFMSLSAKPKDDARGRMHKNGTTPEERRSSRGGFDDTDSDIPF